MLALAIAAASFAASDACALMLQAERSVHESGMVIIHSFRDKLPVVRINILIKAGSVDDPLGKAGLASFTAAILDEGTKKRTSQEISEEIEFVGGSLSAGADVDYTALRLSVLKKDIDTGFGLLADILLNPAFRSKDFKRQRELYLGRIRQEEEDPSNLAWKAFIRALYPGHPYGQEVHGNAQSIRSLTRREVSAFHKTHFTPGNAVLVAVGDISREELDSLVSKYLGAWLERAKGTASKSENAAFPEFPSVDGKLVLTERDVTQASLVMGHAGVPRSHPDYYAIQVMNYILGGGGFSSRLMDRVREDLGLAYGIYSGFVAYMDGGYFFVEVQTKNSAARQVLDEIRKAMSLMREQGATEAELADAKAYLTGSLPRRMNTTSKTASLLGAAELYDLGLDYPEKYMEAVNAVSLEDVLRVAQERLNPDALVVAATARLKEANLDAPDTHDEGAEAGSAEPAMEAK
jgi:zinc protease